MGWGKMGEHHVLSLSFLNFGQQWEGGHILFFKNRLGGRLRFIGKSHVSQTSKFRHKINN
jgi:hypothetical protein